MKKHRFWATVLAFVMLLMMAGCAQEQTDKKRDREKTEDFTPGTVYIMKDTVEFTPVYLYRADKVVPPKPNGAYTYNQADEGMTYLVLVMDVKNLGETSLEAEELTEVVLTLGKEEITAKAQVETDYGTSLDRYYDIAPLVTARIHYLFQIPEDQYPEELALQISAGDRSLKGKISTEELENCRWEITLGGMITDDRTVLATVEDVYISDILKPENPNSYYHYFQADSGKTYLIMKLTVKNLDSIEAGYHTIAGAKCIYDGKYEYPGFVVFEKDNGGDLSSYSYSNYLAPLEENRVYLMMEIPEEAQNGPLTLELYLAGQYCYYSVG